MSHVDAYGEVAFKEVTVAWLLNRYAYGGRFTADVPPKAAPGPAPRGPLSPARLRAWNLRRLRAARNWTLKDMSRETGVGSTFLTEMERNARAISIKTIDRIAAGLGLAPSKVLAELDAPPPPHHETRR